MDGTDDGSNGGWRGGVRSSRPLHFIQRYPERPTLPPSLPPRTPCEPPCHPMQRVKAWSIRWSAPPPPPAHLSRPVIQCVPQVPSRRTASFILYTLYRRYRLENGFPRGSSVYAAARDAAYVVLLVTPRYLSDHTRCLELLAALRRPPEQVLVW